MNQKMLRFLTSIKIENPERFDLDFDLIGRDPFRPDHWQFEIVKETPWSYEDLDEFQTALGNINYGYSLRFSYKNEPTVKDAIALLEGWHLSNYRKPAIYKVSAQKKAIVLSFSSKEEMAEHKREIRDLKSFLNFLNYNFEVVGEVAIPSVEEVDKTLDDDPFVVAPIKEEVITPKPDGISEVEPTPKAKKAPIEEPKPEIKEEKAEAKEEPKQEASPKEDDIPEELAPSFDADRDEDFEEEPMEQEAPSEIQAREEENEEALRKAQEELIEEMKKNEELMIEERRRQKARQRGNYKPYDAISPLFALNMGAHLDIDCNIFSVEVRTTRRNPIYTIGLEDGENAIYGVIFIGRSFKEEDVKKLKVGSRVRIRGAIEISRFNNEKQINIHYADLLPPKEKRQDPYPEKRVELHLHTKMSTMDGLGDIEDYIATAQRFGMKALAVTDHGVIQSFPPAESANKAYARSHDCEPLKMLYGCELYMFDKPKPVFNNISDQPLSQARYCVFDFETTGLSHTYDRPIEFGAVIIENGFPGKTMQLFIDPKMDLSDSKEALAINHITEDDLRGAPNAAKAAKLIHDFIGDAVLVAHNAVFDVPFLNWVLAQGGYEPIKNVVIDTLPVANYLFPEAGSMAEGHLATRLNVREEKRNGNGFHRADYDARVLGQIWMAMMPYLQKHFGKENVLISDLANLHSDDQRFYRHMRTYHVCVIAKNKEGLRDLYKIISESETTYLAGASGFNPPLPKVPREFLQEHRANLFVGSACFNGLVFENALNGTQESLEKEMAFYDYVEVQPKENYSWLINLKKLNEDRLIEVLRRIIDTADKMGKMVCATGDCHYVNPEDKIFRDIYIAAEGLGKSVHPLMRERRKEKPPFPNPDQHFRSTQEMMDSFMTWLPEEKCKEIIITNTNKIADACEPLQILKDKLYKPDANLPGSAEKLRELCYNTLHEVYGEHPDEKVVSRLEEELQGIIGNGYAVTYWIAHLLVKKAAEDGYFIGSRGSVGSSFAATMAKITEVNPLAPHYLCPHCHHFEWASDSPETKNIRSGFDLPKKKCPECGEEMKRDGQSIPFQVFLGFHAEKVPDIDLNFPADYQARGHLYTRELLSTKEENESYAKHEFVHSPHIIRAGTIAAAETKNAFGYVKGFLQKQKLQEELKKNPSLPSDLQKQILSAPLPPERRAYAAYLASHCTGVKRTTGQHPGGIVVIPADMDIFDFTPFQHPADDPEAEWLTTHYEFASMHDCVLKLDELGHVDPVALRMQCLLTNINLGKVADEIPCDDPAVLSLFSSPDALKMKSNPLGFKTGAVALPEFGTPFVQGLLEEAHPKDFNDLLIISGLSHGTDVWNSNAEDLVVKQGKTLQEVVGCRDDIMNYLIDEGVDASLAFQFMETVRKNKDRCNAKKIEKMIPELAAKGVPDWYLDSCRKIQYLFPRAHAVAYVIGAVRAGWFKIYHPLAFYATYFTTRCDKYDIQLMNGDFNALVERTKWLNEHKNDPDFKDTDKELIKALQAAVEMRDRGYNIGNIDLMKSSVEDWVIDEANKQLIPPFKVIPGFPTSTAIGIVKARKKGNFLSRRDLKDRVKKEFDDSDPAHPTPCSIGDTAINTLSELHVLDGLGETNQMSLFDFGF